MGSRPDCAPTRGLTLTCEIVPVLHAFESAEERGISPDEMKKAVLMGSKERKSKNKYIGTYGACRVPVIETPCRLYVMTVMIRQ